jgi:hypothetical protein
MLVADGGPLAEIGANLDRSSWGSFCIESSTKSATEEPPRILRTGMSTANSCKNHVRISTATSESIPSSINGIVSAIFSSSEIWVLSFSLAIKASDVENN